MANNYLLFSHLLVLISPEAVAWAKKQMEKLDQDFPLFSWVLDDDCLLMWSEGSGDTDVVIELLQDYLIKFDPGSAIVFEWAMTCSAPRPGEFGGGWCFITATELRCDDECLRQLIKKHRGESG